MTGDLERLRDLARAAGVGFSLVYEESADTWYFTCDSAAPAERTITKSLGYESTISNAVAHLESLAKSDQQTP
jgi:hypothetical protein